MNKSDLLSPFGWLYRAIGGARRSLYAKGVFESVDLGVPTISIGNLTVGGTGKTPLVAFAARILAEQGEKVCILTRGYKRENERRRVLVSNGERIFADAKQSGDEPLELARALLGKACVIADADRRAAGRWARANLGATVFVLDDAFQHLKVRRALDIVCIDATNPFGSGKSLTAGILREPLSSLKCAGAIVVTRANLVAEKQIIDLKTKISAHNPNAEIFVSKNVIATLTDFEGFNAGAQSENGASGISEQKAEHKFLAFCALGNPENFFHQLRLENFELAATRKFPDHHFYTQRDVDELQSAAAQNGATALLTTAKDAVKLAQMKINRLPCLIAESELVFDNEARLKNLIAQSARRKI